jgi:hypothetical protein
LYTNNSCSTNGIISVSSQPVTVTISSLVSFKDLFDVYRTKGFVKAVLLFVVIMVRWTLNTRLGRWITKSIKAFLNVTLYCLEVYCRWLIDRWLDTTWSSYIRDIRNKIKQW